MFCLRFFYNIRVHVSENVESDLNEVHVILMHCMLMCAGVHTNVSGDVGDFLRSFTEEDISVSTHKFSNCCLIGAGGYAKVSRNVYWYVVLETDP